MATYGLATVWDLRRPGEDPKKATQLYKEILAAAPDSPMIPWTELALARQMHLVPVGQEPDYAAVNQAYQHILDKFPGHLAAKEAFLYLQSIQLAKLEPKSTRAAVAKLEDFVAREKKEFLSPAWSLLAVGYTTLGDQEKRLLAEKNSFETTEVDPSDPFIEFAWAYWNLGTIAEFEVGDFDLARKYYNLLLEKYPTDRLGYGCEQALARMDALERVGQPGGYRRELIEVQAMDPAAPDPLSAYVYLQSPAMLDLAGDHLGPLALYTLEHARSLRW